MNSPDAVRRRFEQRRFDNRGRRSRKTSSNRQTAGRRSTQSLETMMDVRRNLTQGTNRTGFILQQRRRGQPPLRPARAASTHVGGSLERLRI